MVRKRIANKFIWWPMYFAISVFIVFKNYVGNLMDAWCIRIIICDNNYKTSDRVWLPILSTGFHLALAILLYCFRVYGYGLLWRRLKRSIKCWVLNAHQVLNYSENFVRLVWYKTFVLAIYITLKLSRLVGCGRVEY